jgi:hypothetical protein
MLRLRQSYSVALQGIGGWKMIDTSWAIPLLVMFLIVAVGCAMAGSNTRGEY